MRGGTKAFEKMLSQKMMNIKWKKKRNKSNISLAEKSQKKFVYA